MTGKNKPHPNPPQIGEGTDRVYRTPVHGDPAPPPIWGRLGGGVFAWLLPLGALLTLAGYVGPWVPHKAAGLVITGLDLAEYVKFLPQVRSGDVGIWREVFYLPLVFVSLSLSLWAYRAELALPRLMRWAMLGLAAVTALNLLPPAWTPGRLTTPEFRLQTGAMIICLGLAAVGPMLALLPRWIGLGLPLVLPLAGGVAAVVSFAKMVPLIQSLYNAPLGLGWGPPVLILGGAVISGASFFIIKNVD